MNTSRADQATADAFASSWNHLRSGSVYTTDQFEDWFAPLTRQDVQGRRVLELGCGNASLLVHLTAWVPAFLEGVDLGDSVLSARQNMLMTGFEHWQVTQADLTTFESGGFDLVFCIGVLHHLKNPRRGFDAVLRNVKAGGRFHCWVYAREGNGVILHIVDPIRRFACRLPWWVTKYFLATPLVAPYYLYAKGIALLGDHPWLRRLPLYAYSRWIARRKFAFFQHVAFDQLVTPQTTYISRAEIEDWLASDPRIDPQSVYIILRNGNSWKFGGRLK